MAISTSLQSALNSAEREETRTYDASEADTIANQAKYDGKKNVRVSRVKSHKNPQGRQVYMYIIRWNA